MRDFLCLSKYKALDRGIESCPLFYDSKVVVGTILDAPPHRYLVRVSCMACAHLSIFGVAVAGDGGPRVPHLARAMQERTGNAANKRLAQISDCSEECLQKQIRAVAVEV